MKQLQGQKNEKIGGRIGIRHVLNIVGCGIRN